MKKIIIILGLILSLGMFGCEFCEEDEEIPNTEIKIIIDYPGEYYIFIENSTENGCNVYGFSGDNHTEIKENDIIDIVGKLNNVEISTYKLYEPYENDLIVQLFIGDDIISKSIATNGIREAELYYQF
ncbi:MAG: hypothetical protein ACFFC1_06210 [Promethearchaeota archaeon]